MVLQYIWSDLIGPASTFYKYKTQLNLILIQLEVLKLFEETTYKSKLRLCIKVIFHFILTFKKMEKNL